MTNTKLITSLIVEDKLLLKNNSQVKLPFGCEYSIYLKNLENKKVSIGIKIDGQDILNGSKILLNPKEEMTLERFVEELSEGRKLRFIEKTKEISDFRGNKAEDGLIIISYQYEKDRVNKGFGFIGDYEFPTYGASRGLQSNSLNSCANSVKASYSANSVAASLDANCLNDKGITVEGTESKQSFNRGYIGDLEYKEHFEVIELFGYVSECGISPNEETYFTKSKFCPSCGTFYEASDEADYCCKDGTYLKKINTKEEESIILNRYPKSKAPHIRTNQG